MRTTSTSGATASFGDEGLTDKRHSVNQMIYIKITLVNKNL